MSSIDNLDKSLIYNIFSLIKENHHQEALENLNRIDIESQAPEFKGHLYSWKAQCLAQTRAFDEAIRCYNQAIRMAKANNEMDVVQELRTHRDQASAQAAALALPQSTSDKNPITVALALADEDPNGAMTALTSHLEKLIFEDNPKEYILCILALARLSPAPQPLLNDALAWANRADDPNLISAVKRTMDHLGIKAPTKTF